MDSKEDTPASSKDPQDNLAMRQLRVLVVEDEAIIALELELMLEELGAHVVGVAANAVDAELLVEAHKPDFLTMDINIKGNRDGVTAAQDIFRKHGIRSVFVSAYSDAATRTRAEICNAYGWIRKPVEKRDLAEALDRIKPAAP